MRRNLVLLRFVAVGAVIACLWGAVAVVNARTHASAAPHSAVPIGVSGSRALGKDVRGAAGRESSYCGSCTPPLIYNGGKVVGTPTKPGDLTVYPIYWAPAGKTYSATGSATESAAFKNIVDGYLKNVAADSGKTTNVYAVHTQYFGKNGASVQYSMHFGKRVDDTAAYPASGCTVSPGYTACLTDLQMRTELATLIKAQGLPKSDAHMYSLFLPAGVLSCDAPSSCSDTAFCGYHSNVTVDGVQTLWSDEAFPDLDGCNTGQHPNGNAWADTAIKTESHELSETITDPYSDGWTDKAGNENGDSCSQDYGTPLGSTNAADPTNTRYNQVIGTGKYYTQTEFSNAAYAADPKNGCVLTSTATAPPVRNVVSFDPVTPVPNDGTTQETIFAQVTFGGNPVIGDDLLFSVDSSGGKCGAVPTGKQLTGSDGFVGFYYTASTDNVSCVISVTEGKTGQTGSVVLANGTPPAPPHADRIGAKDGLLSAIDTSMTEFPVEGSASHVVLASNKNNALAVSGAPLAVAVDGPLLLTAPDALNKKTATEIQRVLRAGSTVYLIGDTATLSDAVATKLTQLGYVVSRVGGADQYATAVSIAGILGNPSTVIEASSDSLIDTMFAATIAAKIGGTVLLTNGKTQAPATAAYLAAHPGQHYAVGDGAVASDPAATPVNGQNRSETATAVAEEFFTDMTTIGIVNEKDLPDAIGATVELGFAGASFLMVDSNHIPGTTTEELQAFAGQVDNLNVYGDATNVPDDIVQLVLENL